MDPQIQKDKQVSDDKINQQYDAILATNLEKRLKRTPTADELKSGDNDADLVNQTLWELIVQLSADVDLIKKKIGI